MAPRGGAGRDLLVGASATGDTFKDTVSGLNADTMTGFAATDVINITDLAPAQTYLSPAPRAPRRAS